MARSILIVDDEESIRQTLGGILEDEGYEVYSAEDGSQALIIASEEHPDVILLDIWMPGMDGIATLQRLRENHPPPEVIMITGHGTIETAVQAIKLGAYDFIQKPLDMHKVLITIQNVLNYRRLEQENLFLKQKLEARYTLVGEAPQMQKLKQQIDMVSPANSWILITGENGTGKELVARAIHRQSMRADKPFVEVNCAAIPETLIESELFGHEKGAFTGATNARNGKFDLAHEGTLFLDEIADMSLKTQAKILRVLEEQTFNRVGGSKTLKVDVRVIAATNKNLEEEMKAGTLREDLFYRLNVIPFHVVPLRERPGDVPRLVEYFLSEIAVETNSIKKELTPEALELLGAYHWPGNVRELRNMVERLVILTPARVVTEDDIPDNIHQKAGTVVLPTNEEDSFREAKSRFEKEFIIHKLKKFNGNIAKTAEAIGLERSHLYRKIKNYEIET